MKRKYAYVNFLVGEKTYRLKLDKTLLKIQVGFWSKDAHFLELKNKVKLYFPSINTEEEIGNLRQLWNELVGHGFEPA